MFQVFLYICGCGAVVALLLCLRETWRWRLGKSPISVIQLFARWANALILVALTMLILLGPMYKGVRQLATSLLAVLVLLTLLVMIALVDLYEVAKAHQKGKRELLKQLRKDMEETFHQAKPREPEEEPGSNGR